MRRILSDLPRADQRRWAEIYLLGLMNVQGRKSIRNIAEFAGVGTGLQSLQQFINHSPWDPDVVRRKITSCLVESRPARAWTIEHAVIPKRGDHSVGVERRFVVTEGRTVNCQLGIGLHLMLDPVVVPVDWRILLSSAWTEHTERRRQCRIPDSVSPCSEQDLVVDMIKGLASVAGRPSLPVLVERTRDIDPSILLTALAGNGIDFIAEVSPNTLLQAATHPQPVPARDMSPGMGVPLSVKLVTDPDRDPELVRITSATARLAGLTVRVLRVQCVSRDSARFWITNQSDQPVGALAELIAAKVRAEGYLAPLRDRYGVRDFEGRSYLGWHHHMTMVSAAQALGTMGNRN